MNKKKRIVLVLFIIVGLHALSGIVSEAIATSGDQRPKPQKRARQIIQAQNR
jgi:hypothetical protein